MEARNLFRNVAFALAALVFSAAFVAEVSAPAAAAVFPSSPGE